jgi:hypothetical protein
MITLLLIIPLIGSLCLIPIKETEVRDLSLTGAGNDKNLGPMYATDFYTNLVLPLEADQDRLLAKVRENKNKVKMKQIALFASLLNLFIAIII